MNRIVKNVAQLTMRSPAWSGGTIRTAGTGLADVPQVLKGTLTPNAAYLMALPAISAITGGLLTRLFTGQSPSGITDYFYPRTGRKNADGTDERLSLPTDLKDAVSYWHDSGQTLLNKESPLLGLAGQVYNNKAYGNVQIANPDDPLGSRIAQKGEFLAKSMLPFGLQNYMRNADQGLGFDPKQMLGLNPAPTYVTRSEAMNKAAEYERDNMPVGTRTQDQADKSIARSRAMGMIRNGDPDAAMKFMTDRKFTADDIDKVMARASSPALPHVVKGLRLDQAISVYRVASPEEKTLIYPLVADKIQRAQERDPEGVAKLLPIFQEANKQMTP
jgi:hypothetical protein